jgi:hypothetical protein
MSLPSCPRNECCYHRIGTQDSNRVSQCLPAIHVGCGSEFGCGGLSAWLWGDGLTGMSPLASTALRLLYILPWTPTVNTHFFRVEASTELGMVFGISWKSDFCLLSHTAADESILLPKNTFDSNQGLHKVYEGWTWTFGRCQKDMKDKACCLRPRHHAVLRHKAGAACFAGLAFGLWLSSSVFWRFSEPSLHRENGELIEYNSGSSWTPSCFWHGNLHVSLSSYLEMWTAYMECHSTWKFPSCRKSAILSSHHHLTWNN